MWYFEDGEGDFTVQILNQLPKQYNILVHQYSSAIENRRQWSLVKADIPLSAGYNATQINLAIKYVPSSRRLQTFSIFALDDLKVRPGRCAHQFDYTYTFSLGYEDLDLEALQPLKGSIGQLFSPANAADDRRMSKAPQVDHTTNSAKGTYYLFMSEESNSGSGGNHKVGSKTTADIDTLAMPSMEAETSDSCIRFAYQMKGNVSFSVLVMVTDNYDYRSQTPVWSAK